MTSREKIDLRGVKETLLITLYGKAGESRMPDSLLKDRFAAEVVDRIDYDFSRLKMRRDDLVGLAIRAYRIDQWTRAFIEAHEQAVVLHLGCGLDSRIFRIAPPAAVRWFDVDYPEVIALRRRLYPAQPEATMIASSVTEPDWRERLPSAGPALIIAEGLLMYLSKAAVKDLLSALTRRMGRGELVFDGFNRLGARLAAASRMVRATGATFGWTLESPRELERLVPGLRLVEDTMIYDPAKTGQFARFSLSARLAIHAMCLIPAFRRLGRLMRYRF
ncbi:class I SAM-dependent methyltransferase [Phreatobacter sp. AB_2022a]|uniref:class I SAM-dependent methyltransferase n=1 Tax=Phreatobacter sp. AB_2022a TaxID=3003134 RepID=UPI00228765AE|nr:class I SAM-dependent methyltransferase [Phreatobacter sp. AB_2022a]MCZ0737301.1 class I SAM-dependent methyltransferase [Phreatobacter sp. AB_2022a]